MPDVGGPYVNLAAICERVLQEGDGSLSLIRVIDRFVVSSVGPDVPTTMPPQTLQLTIVVSLRPGQAVGRYNVTLRPETPSGQQLDAIDLPVNFEGGADRGVNLIVRTDFVAELEGLYWFDVLLDGSTLLTRVPVRVLYQPQRTAGAGPRAEGSDDG
jgi:hypothetical protein